MTGATVLVLPLLGVCRLEEADSSDVSREALDSSLLEGRTGLVNARGGSGRGEAADLDGIRLFGSARSILLALCAVSPSLSMGLEETISFLSLRDSRFWTCPKLAGKCGGLAKSICCRPRSDTKESDLPPSTTLGRILGPG